jgi:predicted Kef-type K+ transport protein
MTLVPTLMGGAIPLLIAVVFLGIVLAKVPSIPLWIIVLMGIGLMIASLVEAVRSGEEQFGSDETKLPEGQQKRGGVS